MDAPKCRLCGQKHYGVEHVWPGSPPEAARKEPAKAGASVVASDGQIGVIIAPSLPLYAGKKQGWDRDKYNAYQREYMRKRRKGVR